MNHNHMQSFRGYEPGTAAIVALWHVNPAAIIAVGPPVSGSFGVVRDVILINGFRLRLEDTPQLMEAILSS
jgi:hypothetical protein